MVILSTINETGFITQRKDKWWVKPAIQGGFFGGFAIYTIIVLLFGGDNFKIDEFHYLSPIFDPEVDHLIPVLPYNASPAFALIWAPVGFRATCYYGRKVYYRAFFMDPAGCAIGELRTVDQKYKGENKWPFILNNLHRYFFYAAFVLMLFHWLSFTHAIWVDGSLRFGVGVLILFFDSLFLSLYILSCHSCKHIVGGGLNSATGKASTIRRFRSWKFIKKLNTRHGTYFWLSMITVLIGDLYIRLGAMGILDTDWRYF